jgi:hypothetical protein
VRALPLLVATGIAGCAAAPDDGDDPVSFADEHQLDDKADLQNPALHRVYHDDWFDLISDRAMTTDEIDTIYNLTADAYDFDTTRQGLGDVAALAAPIQVAIARNALMKQITGQAGGGIAWDANTFIMNHSITSTTPYNRAAAANTVAHELEHLHMDRMHVEAASVTPIYASEGIACVAGDAYLLARGVTGGDLILAEEATTLRVLAGADGQDLFAHFDTTYGAPAKIYERELAGALFLEVVAKRTGIALLPAWGRLARDLRAGTPFAAAFATQFGTSLADAKAMYVQYLDDTASDPATRFAGTVWAGH